MTLLILAAAVLFQTSRPVVPPPSVVFGGADTSSVEAQAPMPEAVTDALTPEEASPPPVVKTPKPLVKKTVVKTTASPKAAPAKTTIKPVAAKAPVVKKMKPAMPVPLRPVHAAGLPNHK